MGLSVIESIIIRKVENVFSKELLRLSKDMVAPMDACKTICKSLL